MTEPQGDVPVTEAGKALAERPLIHTTCCYVKRPKGTMRVEAKDCICGVTESILAIEEEARVDALNGASATDFQHQLVQRNIDLTNALTAYGDHRQPCGYGPGLRCTCGWLDKLRALMAKEPRP